MSEEKPKAGSPLLLLLVGLLLIVGGWKVSDWTPPREPGLIDELRRMADGELREKLDGYARPERPLAIPGRLALLVGLGLFGLALVQMYRAPVPAKEAAPET